MVRDLAVDIRHNPSLDFTVLPPHRGGPDKVPAAPEPLDLIVSLRRYQRDRLHISAFQPYTRSPKNGTHHAYLEVSETSVLRKAARLRSIWHERVVHRRFTDADGMSDGGFPFSDVADLSPIADRARRVTEELAEAGRSLLKTLLAGDGAALRSFRDFLMDTLASDDCLRISFDSDLHLPWPMLAVEPGDGEEVWDSFLGHRHQVEQTGTSYQTLQAPGAPRTLPVTSLNTDSTLEMVAKAPEVRKLLEERSHLTVHTESETFLEALSGAMFDEDLMYFWCHGHFVENGSPHPHLVVQLSDDRHIDADLVEDRRDRFTGLHDSRFRPFVLLNACHSGQAATVPELEHLGAALIKLGADGVLGPQIEIPQVFATEYAYAFLDLYLAGEHTAGEISQALVRRFAREFHNPLALAYSLHCGIDSRLEVAS
ncbi:CHAT domain-containing protein [Streptomyces sp. SP18CS02]|uniref:CHAT domain-containing protein n=1 Tax=Streptomyces sp. SP18CS02 TaxID=3002531 RepID=UPI002E7A3F34|nr:CHAT domain-containing protein [Streptomyces sp. SP18CS02]MEE1753291.1 CHAT domain-containing protein [Streptomyces sp. SP18CS02]